MLIIPTKQTLMLMSHCTVIKKDNSEGTNIWDELRKLLGAEEALTVSEPVFLFFKVFIYYAYSVLSARMPAHLKRASDFIIDGCEPPCSCWELNSGTLEEQPVLLTGEPSLQPEPVLLFLTSYEILWLLIPFWMILNQFLSLPSPAPSRQGPSV